jgi:predicted nucleic acid-binding protein
MGRARFLVTGDKEHLLPLKIYKHVKIVDAAGFLTYFKK